MGNKYFVVFDMGHNNSRQGLPDRYVYCKIVIRKHKITKLP